MTDLEIIRLCAEAMEYQIRTDRNDGDIWCNDSLGGNVGHYDPFHNDEQVFALVKKFPSYCIAAMMRHMHPKNDNPDLNRAICVCVANMPKAKHE